MTMDAYWPGTKVLRGETLPGARSAVRTADADGAPLVIAAQLQEALAISRAVAARAKERYYAALHHFSPALAAIALEHAHTARTHAERIRGRLAELGGRPDESTDTAAPESTADLRTSDSLIAAISRDLAAGNVTIDRYRAIAAFFVTFDAATQELLEDIVAAEERYASDLAGLLAKASAPYYC